MVKLKFKIQVRHMHAARGEINTTVPKIPYMKLNPGPNYIRNFNYKIPQNPSTNINTNTNTFTRSATYKLELKQNFSTPTPIDKQVTKKNCDEKIQAMENESHRHPPICHSPSVNGNNDFDFVANETSSSSTKYIKGTEYAVINGQGYRVHLKRINGINNDKIREKYDPEKISNDNIFDNLGKHKDDTNNP